MIRFVSVVLVFFSFFATGQNQVDTLYKQFSIKETSLLKRVEFPITVLPDGNPFVLRDDMEIPKGVKVRLVPDSISVGASGKLVLYINRRVNMDPVILVKVTEKYNVPSERIVKFIFEQEQEAVVDESKVVSVVIKGKVFDIDTKSTLVGKVNIWNLESNEKVTFSTDNSGEFHTSPLSTSTDYVVQVGAAHCRVQLDTIKAEELVEDVFSKNYYLEKFEEGEIVPLENVLFKVGTSEMLPLSYAPLDGLVLMMKLNPDMKIRIDGHTDNTASKASSLKLSSERAGAVKSYLMQNKVSSKRIATKGAGGSHPVVSNTSEENRRKNRRVEFVVLKL